MCLIYNGVCSVVKQYKDIPRTAKKLLPVADKIAVENKFGVKKTKKFKSMLRLNSLLPSKTSVLSHGHSQRKLATVGYFSKTDMRNVLKKIPTDISEKFVLLGVLNYINDTSATGVEILELGVVCSGLKDHQGFRYVITKLHEQFPYSTLCFWNKKIPANKTAVCAEITLVGGRRIKCYMIPSEICIPVAEFVLSLPAEVKNILVRYAAHKLKVKITPYGLYQNGDLLSISTAKDITSLLGLPDDFLRRHFQAKTKQEAKNVRKDISPEIHEIIKQPGKLIKTKKQERSEQKILKQFILKHNKIKNNERKEQKKNETIQKHREAEYRKLKTRELEKVLIGESRRVKSKGHESPETRNDELDKKTKKTINRIRRAGLRINGKKVSLQD